MPNPAAWSSRADLCRRLTLAIAALVCAVACTAPAEPDPVELTVQVEPSEGTVRVEIEGRFGAADGKRLWMARGVTGAYEQVDFTPFVSGLRVWGEGSAPLQVEKSGDTWQVGGNGDLRRYAYQVDVRAMAAQVDSSFASDLKAGGGFLVGYGLFLMVEGSEDRSCRVHLEMPAGWRSAWSLPRSEDGTIRADGFFELLDEPVLLGPSFRSLEVEEAAPERMVHAWTDSVEASAVADKLAAAASLSAAALKSLDVPQRESPYHIFFNIRQPQGGERLGWALEHGRSFHCLAGPDILDWPTERLAYHLLHHEMHAWMPRRLYTDRLHPLRQMAGEGSEFVWFAEGFPQYLSFCALAKSGAVDRKRALEMLARRFAGPYLALAPQDPISMTELSQILSKGDHQHWFYGFAGGGLLAMMIDQQMRARDPDHGLREALVALSEDWLDDAQGIPEAEFERFFSEAAGFDVAPLFARYVRGPERLPLEEILTGAGIVPADGGKGEIWGAGAGFAVLDDAQVGDEVRSFRRGAF